MQKPETFKNIRELKTEININSDDLREVLILFLSRLNLTDLLYALITMETEYEKRRYNPTGDIENAA